MNKDIILENSQLRLTVGPDCIAKSLIHKASGQSAWLPARTPPSSPSPRSAPSTTRSSWPTPTSAPPSRQTASAGRETGCTSALRSSLWRLWWKSTRPRCTSPLPWRTLSSTPGTTRACGWIRPLCPSCGCSSSPSSTGRTSASGSTSAGTMKWPSTSWQPPPTPASTRSAAKAAAS